jgi:nitrogen fixation NifU-like protein
MKEFSLYNETVMDHFLNPRNSGVVENENASGEVGAAACGDIMKISLRIRDNVIEDAKWRTFGCGSAIASSDMLCELIKGKTLDEVSKFTNQDVVDALGSLPAVKIHCSVLAEECLKEALDNYSKRKV